METHRIDLRKKSGRAFSRLNVSILRLLVDKRTDDVTVTPSKDYKVLVVESPDLEFLEAIKLIFNKLYG